MTSPWIGLDAATGTKDLYLDPSVKPVLDQHFEPYLQSLEALVKDNLNHTSGCFGTKANPLAVCLEQAFDSVGTELTNYLTQQQSQVLGLRKTAYDALDALQAKDHSA